MRLAALPLVSLLAFSGAAFGADATNMPPMPPHWYQRVAPEVTLHSLSPVEYFRALLGMTPAQRNRVLASKPPAERKAVLAKIAEYQAMSREAREERLHQTELHWRLVNLMRLPASMRGPQLKQISPLEQPMILGALANWDALSDSVRNAILEKESYTLAYLQWQSNTGGGFQNLSEERQKQWVKDLRRWQAFSDAQRAQWSGDFRKFVSLTPAEQKDALNALSESERQEMEQSLRAFALLPPRQREFCIRAFQKFATMSLQERNQFLHNAARWQAMTGHEREVWRQLVEQLPPMPPLPPDLERELPPMPPGMTLRGIGSPTNESNQHAARD